MIWPTKDEITQTLVTNVVGTGKTIKDLHDQWVIKHLLVALREIIYGFIVEAKNSFEQTFVQNAIGKDLNLRGEERGISRKLATAAIHQVTLLKSSPVLVDTFVPDNFLLTTTPVGDQPPIKFRVRPGQNAFIPAGQQQVNVLVECDEAGVIGNVHPGAINLVAQAGFDEVTNSVLITDGVKEESDEDYRGRILERMQNPDRGGTPGDYLVWAKEVAGVSDAIILPLHRGNGTVDVIPLPPVGLPSVDLISTVQSYLSEKAPLGADVKAISPAPRPIDVTIIGCKFRTGYSLDNGIPIIQPVIADYITKTAVADREIRVVKLISAIAAAYDPIDTLKEPILTDFSLTVPAANIALEATELFTEGTILIS